MHQIYQHAYLTIVAAAGENSEYGLPGIGSVHREFQPRADIGDKVLVSTLPEPSHVINKSKWMTRAWTYQEAVFSRRRLYFTDQQMYFGCPEMACRESILPPLGRVLIAVRNQFEEGRPGHQLLNTRQAIFWTNSASLGEGSRRRFAYHVGTYTTRDLAKQSDALDAFRAILQLFHSLGTCWGVPENTFMPFSEGLLWSHSSGTKARRRPEFPTWSWLGWKGQAIISTSRSWDRFQSTATFSIETRKGNLFPLSTDSLEHNQHLSRPGCQSLLSPRLHVRAPVFQPEFEREADGIDWSRLAGSKKLDSIRTVRMRSRDPDGPSALFSSLDESQGTDSLVMRISSLTEKVLVVVLLERSIEDDHFCSENKLLFVSWKKKTKVAKRIGIGIIYLLSGQNYDAMAELCDNIIR